MKQSEFNRRCYEVLTQVPEGKVTTYRHLAQAMGARAWRAVGSAMARNEQLVAIPCHRVVRSDGTIGRYAQGAARKAQLLRDEGVEVVNGMVKPLDSYRYRFGGV